MRSVVSRVRRASLVRFAAVAAVGVSAAACSSDVTRFDANPFQGRNEVTNSVPQNNTNQAQVPGHQLPPRTQVEQQPLNPPPGNYRPATVPAAPPPQAKKQQLNAPQNTAAVQNGWSWDGGTAVTVQPGETVYSIARKHNVPADVILRANNLQNASMIQPGQRLVIPRRKAANAPQAPAAQQNASLHTVGAGETIYSLSRRYKVTPQAIANANNLTLATQLRIGQQVRIPGGSNTVVNNVPQTPPPPVVQPQRRANVQTIQNNEAPPAPETVGIVRPNVVPQLNPEAPRADNDKGPGFRWPVRGRIISAFGRKPNGQQNDGINLSVPEGTPIHASEDGVVAYAGNELKGFGNLVLIRHADNWVTAYAHLGTIDVKKDQKVRRGDIIAKAGQTGGVTSPQLHFEIRKGSNPVDPEKHLSGT